MTRASLPAMWRASGRAEGRRVLVIFHALYPRCTVPGGGGGIVPAGTIAGVGSQSFPLFSAKVGSKWVRVSCPSHSSRAGWGQGLWLYLCGLLLLLCVQSSKREGTLKK